MEYFADLFLVAGALGAGIYCYVLARRLSNFNDLEGGMGGAVAVLSAQVDDLTRTLAVTQKTAGTSTDTLGELTDRAENVAKKLELMVAAMHDLPEKDESSPPTESETGLSTDPSLSQDAVFFRHPRTEKNRAS